MPLLIKHELVQLLRVITFDQVASTHVLNIEAK